MNDELKKEILSLLESPELREYLLAPPEKLCCAQYAEIICGAPVSLYRKRELLLRLKAETPEEDLWAILGALHCIEDALKALEQADASDAYLSVELIGYDAEERRTDTIDGPESGGGPAGRPGLSRRLRRNGPGGGGVLRRARLQLDGR